ncbi:D-alanyl-D-alanine carboxypeptidase family protein [Clostridium tyrobutyricum]|uniref:D-alanyl-D-alanine carboxypeptidase family protein n=1 Tax=Clostridium tyrobutyricum TaxID=1519 RepID=UPI0010AAEF43|nr:D-alanyl-D-alanine carboxypeptidase family protein [Clostridium tyrobutyricum]QCH27610.1 D-alanyl-D-alanine carboxypeptidase DacF [Clostridium tyrobutyricum]
MIKNKFYIFIAFIIVMVLNINVYAKEPENSTPVKIYGESAITVDMQTGEIIYSKNIDNRMYPASTTKLLTALILSENRQKNSTLKYTKDAKSQPAASLNDDIHSIDVGDTMTASSAMDGLLMYSANDIAYMIAENVSKNAPSFADLMNKKVKELNLKNTHFVTPNGLHNKDHYSSAYDMSIIAKTSFKNPWIKDTMGKSTTTIKTSKGVSFTFKNRNKLLGKDGCIAGKTGYTIPAGRCLVTVYERSGRKILGVVMKSIYDPKDTYVFNDMEKIINWSYTAKPSILYKKDSIVEKMNIRYKPLGFGPSVNISVPLKTSDNVTYYENDINKNELKKSIGLNPVNYSNLGGKKPIGTLQIKERDSLKKYSLYSELSRKYIMKKSLTIYISTIIILAIIALIIRKTIIRKKQRRYKFYKYR